MINEVCQNMRTTAIIIIVLFPGWESALVVG